MALNRVPGARSAPARHRQAGGSDLGRGRSTAWLGGGRFSTRVGNLDGRVASASALRAANRSRRSGPATPQPEGRALPRFDRAHCILRAVSILAQPEGRALRRSQLGSGQRRRVSILAQPEGRALPPWATSLLLTAIVFQSSPSPKAGRYVLLPCRTVFVLVVSILAQPEGRALPDSRRPR